MVGFILDQEGLNYCNDDSVLCQTHPPPSVAFPGIMRWRASLQLVQDVASDYTKLLRNMKVMIIAILQGTAQDDDEVGTQQCVIV